MGELLHHSRHTGGVSPPDVLQQDGELIPAQARSGVAIPDATNRILTVANAQTSDAVSYSVRVSNAIGNTNSATATLTVHVNDTLAPVAVAFREEPLQASIGVGHQRAQLAAPVFDLLAAGFFQRQVQLEDFLQQLRRRLLRLEQRPTPIPNALRWEARWLRAGL